MLDSEGGETFRKVVQGLGNSAETVLCGTFKAPKSVERRALLPCDSALSGLQTAEFAATSNRPYPRALWLLSEGSGQ
eukprot:scaffold2141_cov282-Pinguiococcus_pyrenoidosus.AAC.14